MSDGNGALPEGWEPVKVGDSVKFNYGKALSAKQRDHTGFPVYGSNGVIGQHSKPLLEGPALLVGRKGSIGEVHYCDGPCSAIDTTYFVDEFYGQPIRYWYYRLKALPLADLNRATALPGLNRQDAYDLSIALPPEAEQRRIVSKIESLQERSSRARRALSEVGPLLEQFRQSVLRAAFSGRLTADWRAAHRDVEPATELLSRIRTERRHRWEQSELAKYEAKGKQPPKNWQDKYNEPESINAGEVPRLRELPAGWCWASADELTAIERPIIYGIIKPGPDTPGGVPYVRITEMKGRRVHVNDLRRCNPEREEKFKRARLKTGDILISKDGATYGMVAIVPDEAEGANITQHVLRYSVFPEVNNEYIAYVIESPTCQRWIDGQIKGMAMPGINVGDFRRMPVPVPPAGEQLEIRDRIEEFLDSVKSMETEVSESESALTQLDQSILAKAFRGELVPQDPRDEPASELLARIRTTREATGPEKKAKRKRNTKRPGTK